MLILMQRIDYVAPVKITALQAAYKYLGGRNIGSEGDAVLVAEPCNVVYRLLALTHLGIAELQNKVDFIIGDARAYLLVAALLAGEI